MTSRCEPVRGFLLDDYNKKFLIDPRRRIASEKRALERLVSTLAGCSIISCVLVVKRGETFRVVGQGRKTTAVVVAKRIDEETKIPRVAYSFQTESGSSEWVDAVVPTSAVMPELDSTSYFQNSETNAP